MITFTGDRLRVRFDSFTQDRYALLLRCKRLPESLVEFDPDAEVYTIDAPARYAPMLGVEQPARILSPLLLSPFLYDDQAHIVPQALDAKRFAIWAACGSGKTIMQLEWSLHVVARTSGRVLIVTTPEVVPQTIEEAERFYGFRLPIYRIQSRNDMRAWCKGEGPGALISLAITNYEKFNPGRLEDQVVNELRHLSGIVLDEASKLKAGGGKQKWALIKSSRGIEYKLACTATPAPNDTIEFASQASFLERMRTDADIIWTYFRRDPVTHRWTVKPHARAAFFEFMASWSIYVDNPKRYGWRLNQPDVPAPEYLIHEIAPTAQQRAALSKAVSVDQDGQLTIVPTEQLNTIQRMKLSQIAKGFRYRKIKQGQGQGDEQVKERAERIASDKPGIVADLVRDEAAAGLQVLVWTVFDEESKILATELTRRGVNFSLLTGATAKKSRLTILDAFRSGQTPVLISRARLLGFGMNFQCCGSMVFSGWDDSFESFFQAVRRAYRHGQTRRLRVHIPVIRELEGDSLATIQRKAAGHECNVTEMEENYIRAHLALTGKEV